VSFRNPFFPATVTITPSGGTMPVKTNAGDTVTQTGAATALAPPAGTPSAAARAVSAAAQASASQTGNGSITLIAAPGAAKALELHAGQIIVVWPSGSLQAQLQRIDNSAVLFDTGIIRTTGGPSGQQPVPFDFQGATLPVNVGVKLVTSNQTNGTEAAVANITYSVLT
jgi:hypothetical protein